MLFQQFRLDCVYQQVRTIRLRKFPWQPRAKSKQFFVPKFAERNAELDEYMRPIVQRYKAEMRSVFQLFKTVGKFTDQASQKFKEEKRVVFEQEKELFAKNEEINKKILAVQLRDDELRLTQKKRELATRYEEMRRVEEISVRIADEKARKLKEKAAKFIDPANLEEEIEKMLNQRVDYNFAINKFGHLFKNSTKIVNPYLKQDGPDKATV